MIAALTLAGVGALAAGTAFALPRSTWLLALDTQTIGALALAAAGIAAVATDTSIGAAFGNGVRPAFGLDGLSAFFLVVVCGTAVPALLVAGDALRGSPQARPLAALTGGFLLALVGVLAARDAISFLAFWELMTLLPAAAILVARRNRVARHAVFVYLAITHLGGAGVWIAMLTLAHEGALGASLSAGGPQALVAVAALVGFGTKAGLMPLHAWLPRAHPAAPAHVSALMSGVMIKVALYGLIRVLFEWLGPVPPWVGFALLALGALSALGGILYALVQHELKRLLAFSSIENVGIVALGLGASLLLDAAGESLWAALAFAAALLHTANHAAFKSLIFLGAGAFAEAVGALELDRLGGLLRTMPWSGWCFLAGCAAIAGLPPLNGFVSEWLALQALLHLALLGGTVSSIAGALAAAGLAAVAALAVYCFAKVVGLVLLGAPRTPAVAAAVERPARTRAALGLLALTCALLGLLPGLLLPALVALAPGAAEIQGSLAISAPGTGGLPPVGIALALALVVAGALRATGGRRRAAPTPAWACGQRVERRLAWTSAGFTKPLRLVLESVFRPHREVEVVGSGALVQEVRHQAEIPHHFDTALYRPAHRIALRGAAVARRIQSGSLRLYLVYLVALLLAALALARLGALS